MANELLFRQGKLADLKANESTNKVAGSINFTTDEPAIYLDVAEDNGTIVRKRIGSYIARFASIEELKNKLIEEKLTPSQDTLYYAINENALLAYTGTEWKQLNAAGSENGAIADLEDQIDALQRDYNTLNASVGTLQSASEGQAEKIEALEKVIEGTAEAGGLSNQVATHGADIESLKQDMANVDDILDTKADASALTSLETTLTSQISSSINAANAMRYMGTIGLDQDNNVLYPTGNISVGDTYVATDKFMIGEMHVAPGDLVIAKGDEENNIITNNLSWDVVTTGYNSAHNPELSVDGENTVLELDDYSGKSISRVKFEGSGNVVVAADGENAVFTIGLQWGSF